MLLGKHLRTRRWTGRGRTVIVALDHGIHSGPASGLENPLEIVKICDGAGADGVLVTPGVLEQVHASLGDLAVILRLDGCVTRESAGGPMRIFCEVEQALKLGVDAALVTATVGSPYESHELEKVGRTCSKGREYGLPIIAEMLSQRMSADFGAAGSRIAEMPDEIAKDIGLASRVGAELGADAIETRYCGDRESFRRVVASVGRPLLTAGGPMRRPDTVSTLELVNESLEAGAAGVIFGRNIWQQPDPAETLRAVCQMVHEDATVEEALESAQV